MQAFTDQFLELNQWASWLQGHEANPILTEAQEKQGLHDLMPQVWCTKYSEMHGNLNVDMCVEIIEYFCKCEEDSATCEEQNWHKQAAKKCKHALSDNHSHKKVNLSPKDQQSHLLMTPRIIAIWIQTNSVPSIRIMIINGRTASKILRTPIVGLQRKQRKQKENNLLRMMP